MKVVYLGVLALLITAAAIIYVFAPPIRNIGSRILVKDKAPELSCVSDSDCILAVPSDLIKNCGQCQSCKIYNTSDQLVVATNKDWKYCDKELPEGAMCPACIGGIFGEDTEKCVNGSCTKSR